MPPLISIITPSFRNGDWLRLCIASVADQGVDHEHIVQDAGSDDGTQDWLPRDGRVRAFVEKDGGMYDGVNRGLRRAQGQILAYLNCDEQYLPGALEAVRDHFAAHPEDEVLFADAVVVDPKGNYLWHRKSLVPRLWHTELFPLSTLTCATFFRRRVLERDGVYFDPAWRYCGDSVWVRNLLRRRLRLAVLRRFTSVFTHTGDNLSLRPDVQKEAAAYFAEASVTARLCRPLVLLHHRLRRWTGGIYRQDPFSFSLYTMETPDRRVDRRVDHPTFRWRW